MRIRDFMTVGVCLAVAAIVAPPAGAQLQNCSASQDAAVQCFVDLGAKNEHHYAALRNEHHAI